MYCIDTLERLNNEEVAKHRDKTVNGEVPCDYCDKPANWAIPVYNPADAVLDINGAYSTINVCDDCNESPAYLEDSEYFHCDDCGTLFVTHHSHDFLVCDIDGEQFCHACAAKRIKSKSIHGIHKDLIEGKTDGWVRVNAVPGKKLLWKGEFSSYSDFPGHTSLKELAEEILEKSVAASTPGNGGEAWPDKLYPILCQCYQFSVVLAIYGGEK